MSVCMRKAFLALMLVSCSKDPPAREEPLAKKVAVPPVTVSPIPRGDASPPQVPGVTAMIDVAGGSVWGRQSLCGRDGAEKLPAIQYVLQRVDAFRIDHHTVSCAEWADCAAAGGCQKAESERDVCKDEQAVVTDADAHAYCRWRKSHLPTWAQWHRAIRADRKDAYPTGPTWDPSRGCQNPSLPDGVMKRCEYVSDHGVLFAMHNPHHGEWTSDVDCLGGEKRRLAVDLMGFELGVPSWGTKAAEFRCVTD